MVGCSQWRRGPPLGIRYKGADDAPPEAGIGRSEILELTGLSDGGTFATTLTELEQCGFVRAYRDFTREAYGEMYQLVDPFTLFWLRFVEGADDPHWWSANRSGGTVRAWARRAFELLCLWHVPQILRALGVWGVSVSAQSWRSRHTSVPGAQVNLVLDRADSVVNLCEMKWIESGAAYTIDKTGTEDLARKAEVFAAETGTPKALHTTLVTPGRARARQVFRSGPVGRDVRGLVCIVVLGG